MELCVGGLLGIDGFEMILRKFLLKLPHRSSRIARKHPNLPCGRSIFESDPGSTGERFMLADSVPLIKFAECSPKICYTTTKAGCWLFLGFRQFPSFRQCLAVFYLSGPNVVVSVMVPACITKREGSRQFKVFDNPETSGRSSFALSVDWSLPPYRQSLALSYISCL